MLWLQGLGLLLGSLLLIGISWRSLRRPHSHGFYRFFAWEAMLGLLVANAPVWFDNRFAAHQLLSWALLFGSLLVLFLGLHQLRSAGRPDARRDDAELFAFERTSQMVSSGIFRYIRHPLYCSLLLLAWGICWKQANGLTVGLALFASGMLYLTAKRDEAECQAYFGDAYGRYMQRSRMFIPWLF